MSAREPPAGKPKKWSVPTRTDRHETQYHEKGRLPIGGRYVGRLRKRLQLLQRTVWQENAYGC